MKHRSDVPAAQLVEDNGPVTQPEFAAAEDDVDGIVKVSQNFAPACKT